MEMTSLPISRFKFDEENWWAPTLDMLNLQDAKNEYARKIFFLEEYTHRQVFIPTEMWLWTSWLEALSNCELLKVLKTIKALARNDTEIEVIVPFNLNENNSQLPADLRLEVKDISLALHFINENIKACESLVESLMILLLKRWTKGSEGIFEQYTKKKFTENNDIEAIYPIVEKIFSKIDIGLMTLVSGCILSINSIDAFPTISINDSIKHSNYTSKNLKERIDKIHNNLNSKLTTRDDFIRFSKEHELNFPEMNELREGIKKSMASVPDMIQINGYGSLSNLVDDLFTPSGYPFFNLLTTEIGIKRNNALEGTKQTRFLSRGQATVRIRAEGQNYSLLFKRGVPDFIQKSMAVSIEVTFLKNALFKDTDSLKQYGNGSISHNFLSNIHFKSLK